MMQKNLDLSHRIFLHHKWNPEIIEYYWFKFFSEIGRSIVGIFIVWFFFVNLKYTIPQIISHHIISQFFFVLLSSYIQPPGQLKEKKSLPHQELFFLFCFY